MSLKLEAWQFQLNRQKTELCGAIEAVYQDGAEFWPLCEKVNLPCKEGDLVGNTFHLKLNDLFRRLGTRVAPAEVRAFLVVLREDIKIRDFVLRVNAIIDLIDNPTLNPSRHEIIPVRNIEVPDGGGANRSYEDKIPLAEKLVDDAKSKLEKAKKDATKPGQCPGRKGAPCELPRSSVDFMSLLAQWEKRVSDTMRTVGFLEAIERSARDIDTDPKRETVGEERERLKALLILVDQFLTINGFPTELSESFPEDAKKELADLLSRAEFSGCHLILTKLFRAIAFIKDFDKSRQFGRKTINQEEFEEQYTNLLASLHALHQSLKKYVHEVLTREHEGFSNALAGIPDASPAPESDLPDPPHAKSRNPRFPVEEIRPSGPARAPEHAKKLKGE